MIMRPVDESGDIRPVLSSGTLLKGAQAEVGLAAARLELLAGDWWENPGLGNAVMDLLKESRFTEADLQAPAAYVSAYIRETPGVRGVRDVTFAAEGGRFRYACVIETDGGDAGISRLF